MAPAHMLILAAILLSLLIPQLFAADPPPAWGPATNDTNSFMFANNRWAVLNSSGTVDTSQKSWASMAAVAIAISLFANAIAFMVAKSTKSASFERWASGEFYQTTASAVMVTGMLLMATMGFAMIKESGILPAGTTTECAGSSIDVWATGPFAIMKCKLQDKITYSETLFRQAYENNKAPEVKSSMAIYLLGAPIYMGDWDNAVHTEMEKAHYLANRIVPIAVSFHVQYMFADYLSNNMLNIFLPLGILLRILPPFRGIGGLFIVLSIGFYIVFPLAYILLDPSTSKPDPESIIPAGEKLNENACYTTFSAFYAMNTPAPAGAVAMPKAGKAPDAAQLGEELTNLQIESFINPVAALSATLLFMSLLAPVFDGDMGEMLHFVMRTI